MTWRIRYSIAAATGITLVGILATSAVETRLVEERPFVAVRDSAGSAFGPVHSLSPGRYRCRVEAALNPTADNAGSAAAHHSDITRVPIWMGVRDADRNQFDASTRAIRAFDFAGFPTRHFDFPMRLRDSSRRRLVWEEVDGPCGIVPQALTLTRITSLPAAFGPQSDLRGDAPQALARLLAWLTTLLAAAICGGWLRLRVDRRGSEDTGPLARAVNTGGWILAFVVAGSALAFGPSSSLLTLSSGIGSAGAVRVAPFPGLDDLWGRTPYLASGAALLAAGLFGALVVRRPSRIWMLPTAACGLAFAAAQLNPPRDFLTYTMAGMSLWSGTNPYPIRTVLNPPPFLIFTMLLTLLPVQIAAFLWFGLKAATVPLCVGLAAFAVTAAYGLGTGPRWTRPEWIALLAAGRLMGTDLLYGNTNLVVLLCLLATAANWRAQRHAAAGAAVVAGVAIKLTPGMFALTAALAGRWRWAVAVLLVAGALTGVSAMVIEARAPGAGLGFLRYAVPDAHDLSLGRVDNQSLRGWLDRSVGGAAVNTGKEIQPRTLGWGADVARRVEFGFIAVIGLALVTLGRRARRAGPGERDARWADVWAGATLALLLVSPGSWTVHFALLYLPLTVLAARARTGDRLAGAVVLLLGLVITLPAFSRGLAEAIVTTSALTIGSLIALAALLASPPAARA